MTNKSVHAADTDLSSRLVEAAGGLAIVRMRSSAPRASMLSDEENVRFLDLLNELISANLQVDFVDDHTSAMSRDVLIRERIRAWNAAKDARRKTTVLLKKVRMAKSKTLDDILLKAMALEAIDFRKCCWSETLGHSIVNDLLSAECAWRD
jgi:hypothetical protein